MEAHYPVLTGKHPGRATSKGVKCFATFITFSLVIFILIGCSSGKTTLGTVTYYGVPSGRNINYYRVTISGKSRLNKFNYASGWYPTEALDQLFGSISADKSVEALQVQNTLRSQVNTQLIDLQKKWLATAADPNASDSTLMKLMEARRRILAYPDPGSSPFANSIEIEYNPERDLAILHSNEKFAVIISANPDEVVGKITSFAESDKTSLQIKNISTLFYQRSNNQLSELDARASVLNDYTANTINPQLTTLQQVSTDPTTTPEKAVREINILLQLLKTFQP